MPIDCSKVKIETQKDSLLKKVYSFIMSGWPNFLAEKDRELKAFYQR